MQPRKLFTGYLACLLLTLALLPALALAGKKPKEWSPDIRPSDFVRTVDNTYFPLIPGSTLRYRDKTGTETLVVEVTSRTRFVMGVRTTVVIETHAENGQTVEVSENWFAQDQDGNVWYFGELSTDYENGQPAGTGGSWEAGIAGAQPGIIMLGQPSPGDTYFQENAPGIAEDMATVQSIGGIQSTALRTFSEVLKTKEWTPLESNSVEHKYYAPGVGLIREEKGSHWLELIEM
jgi:hypothetical protein